jgi:CheY-like chemotaxis protein
VKDGEQALDYVFRRGGYAGRSDSGPRLILLDLKMPRVSGIEVARALKGDDRTKRIPIVIMTASKEESDIAETYNLGVNSYVVKPLDFESLAEVTRHAGYYHWRTAPYAQLPRRRELLSPDAAETPSLGDEINRPRLSGHDVRVLCASENHDRGRLIEQRVIEIAR